MTTKYEMLLLTRFSKAESLRYAWNQRPAARQTGYQLSARSLQYDVSEKK